MMMGRKDSTGPAPALISEEPQPHWNTATTTPKEAPAASRFITAATTGTSTLRNATISSRQPSRTITPTNSGILALSTVAKSSKIAVRPPT